ncbi:MAG: hypothetical protein EOP09_07070, partial [Proteobacteria bacterium]
MFQGLNFVGGRFLGLVIAPVLFCTACGKGSTTEVKSLAQALTEGESCISLRERVWKELYKQADVLANLPDPASVESEMQTLNRDEKVQGLNRSLALVYEEIFSSASQTDDRDSMLARLAELELGDRTTEEKARTQDELETRLVEAEALIARANPNCGAREPIAELPGIDEPAQGTEVPASGSTPLVDANADKAPLFEAYRKTRHAAVYGAYKTLSVAYQSCNAAQLTALDWDSPTVKGITVVGNHTSGVGLKRDVTSPSEVFRTNPYYSKRVGAGTGCFTQTNSPLIYDYGGKPYASSSASTVLDYFKSSGSGTSALGVDCSGYVSSSLLVGGLRLRKNVSSKAVQTSGVSSSMFMNPENNGISCLKKVAVAANGSINPGDIIASSGHVIMVDSVGADPFGIASITRASDCTSANVKTAKFNFTIVQSAPVFGGIGINRMKASEYLEDNA